MMNNPKSADGGIELTLYIGNVLFLLPMEGNRCET